MGAIQTPNRTTNILSNQNNNSLKRSLVKVEDCSPFVIWKDSANNLYE